MELKASTTSAAVEAWNPAGRYRVRTPEMHPLIFLAATVGFGMRAIILKQVSPPAAIRLS